MKRYVIVGIGAKYIHVNLALYTIAAHVDTLLQDAIQTEIIESTVKADKANLVAEIAAKKPDFIGLSVYIWNIEYIKKLLPVLKIALPHVPVIAGGPEVSFNPAEILRDMPVDYVICGEGETPTAVLLRALYEKTAIPDGYGICCGRHIEPPYTEGDVSALAFPYTPRYIAAASGRIAYIESSRGCPYSCAFCLSGDYQKLRFFPMDYTKRMIDELLKSDAKVIKFVDRTFNADYRRCNDILRYIIDNTAKENFKRFHFEIAADILRKSTLDILKSAPRGLFQVEAGLQSFNEKTLDAVRRKTDLKALCDNVKALLSYGIHTHIDLIAGLPQEDFASFRASFNKAYAIHADMLQPGFLKLLHGSILRKEAEAHGFVFDNVAPYEIKRTANLSEDDLRRIHEAEDACDKLYNSGHFTRALDYVLSRYDGTPFDFFEVFGKCPSMPLADYYERFLRKCENIAGVDKATLRDILCEDFLLSDCSGKLPRCLKIYDDTYTNAVKSYEKRFPKIVGKISGCAVLYSENAFLHVTYEKKAIGEARRIPLYELLP